MVMALGMPHGHQHHRSSSTFDPRHSFYILLAAVVAAPALAPVSSRRVISITFSRINLLFNLEVFTLCIGQNVNGPAFGKSRQKC